VLILIKLSPFGNPASSAMAQRAKADRGVSSEGLITTVQPAASAAPTYKPFLIEHVIIINKFIKPCELSFQRGNSKE
jgi:hypothetical protein